MRWNQLEGFVFGLVGLVNSKGTYYFIRTGRRDHNEMCQFCRSVRAAYDPWKQGQETARSSAALMRWIYRSDQPVLTKGMSVQKFIPDTEPARQPRLYEEATS